MADLLSILTTAASSLSAQRAASATASHNVENANTPGYARQRAVIEATLPAEQYGTAFIGRGADLLTVTQSRDRFLEAQIPAALGQASRSSVASEALSSVHALDPQATGGLGDAISAFYSALRQLSQNAGDASLRAAAVGAAGTLALTFQRTRAGIESARAGLDVRFTGDVSEVNATAQTVARLNAEIQVARGSAGAEPNDLLDARQKAVDRLAELTGAAPVTNSDGTISLFLAGGAPLVVGRNASTLSAVADPANGGHLALLLAAPGGAPAPVAAGGELGGILDARDGALRAAVQGIDQLAWDLGDALNAVHATGTGLDGSSGLVLFDLGASVDGAASRIAVEASIAADPRRLAAAQSAATLPGDGQNALALVATESLAVSGGLDPASALARVVSTFGAAAQGLSALASHDAALRDHLSALRESQSGVSIDEELIEMQKAQRAYEAILKVIQTADEMFETLLQIKE